MSWKDLFPDGRDRDSVSGDGQDTSQGESPGCRGRRHSKPRILESLQQRLHQDAALRGDRWRRDRRVDRHRRQVRPGVEEDDLRVAGRARIDQDRDPRVATAPGADAVAGASRPVDDQHHLLGRLRHRGPDRVEDDLLGPVLEGLQEDGDGVRESGRRRTGRVRVAGEDPVDRGPGQKTGTRESKEIPATGGRVHVGGSGGFDRGGHRECA